MLYQSGVLAPWAWGVGTNFEMASISSLTSSVDSSLSRALRRIVVAALLRLSRGLGTSDPPAKCKSPPTLWWTGICSALGGIRTPGLWNRNPTLYPTELQARLPKVAPVREDGQGLLCEHNPKPIPPLRNNLPMYNRKPGATKPGADRPVANDVVLIQRFKTDPEGGYQELLARYTPVLLRMIRRFLKDPDDIMETYTAICERLRSSDFQALRNFRINSELTPWLSVVVANACRDRFRKQRVVSAPQSVISKLTDRQKHVFKYYYQEQLPHDDIAELLKSKHRIPCTPSHVSSDIQQINELLSVNKRWHLLAALRANRPTVSFDDLAEMGIQPVDKSTLLENHGDGVDDENVAHLQRAIGNLDAEDQLLIQLRYEQGMRANQIAKVMKFDNQKYVYTRLRTIVNRLRRQMDDGRIGSEVA
jgi:DNA-directed RNA polymerase specialized sigma24 family protein